MRAYDSLLNPSSVPTVPFQPGDAIEQLISTAKARKRRPTPDEGLLPPGDRTLQAQPFATVNTSGDSAYQFAAPLAPTTVESQGKKRGRPNKEEHERRVREAAQRGEIYPPPKKIKTPRQSLEGAGNISLTASGMTEADIAEEGSTGKKRAKKAKTTSAATQLAPEIPARISSLEATARVADRMQIDTEETGKGRIPETDVSEFPAKESLLAGIRERIAREEPSSVQSSSTPKPESAPPSESNMYSATPNPPSESHIYSVSPNPPPTPNH